MFFKKTGGHRPVFILHNGKHGSAGTIRCRIMSFHVRSEKFHPIEFPEGVVHLRTKMIHYEGRLALLLKLLIFIF